VQPNHDPATGFVKPRQGVCETERAVVYATTEFGEKRRPPEYCARQGL
jgi:hypothetical protein